MARSTGGARPAPDPGGPPAAGDGTSVSGETGWESVVSSIGPKVARLRQRSGLSLQQLARRAEVSAAAIHKVERGDMVPTVTTLLKIAAALERPIGHFVGTPEGGPVAHLVRADERPELPAEDGVCRAGVTGPPERFRLGGVVTRLPVGAGMTSRAHEGEGFLFVLDGSLEVDLDGEVYALGAGDALHYPADRTAHCRNPGPRETRVLHWSVRGV